MIRVGLIGGIGSGKSEVARLLVSHGALVVDADDLARETLAPGTPGLARVVDEFRPEFLHTDGSLDRSRLAAVVFSEQARLTALNSIVHPHVAERSAELMNEAPADAVVVYDVPLLVENNLQGACDVVVVVDVSPATQVSRLVEQRGMSEAEVSARITAQATREQRRGAADVVIDNDGDLASLERQVTDLWRELVSTDQAYAGVCWRLAGGEAQILLVLAHDGRWLFPKGHREASEYSPVETVQREVAEEAGVRGEVAERRFATFTHWLSDGRRQRVAAYLVRVLDVGEPQEAWRRPTWCPREKALILLSAGRTEEALAEYARVLDEALGTVGASTYG